MTDNISGDIKALKLIHFAISLGLILVYLVIGLTSIEDLKIQGIDQKDLIYLAIPVGAFFLSNLVFKFQLKQVDAKASLEEKFPKYRVASLARWGILEVPVILILFVMPNLIIFGILIIIYLIFLSPSEERMVDAFRSTNS